MLKRTFIMALAMFAAVVFMPTNTFAADEKAPAEMTGLAVGEKVPDFKLKDQNGKEIGLKDLLAVDGTTVLVFHRSANW
jgi:cytochrome oxidase Cu insertion factor (SCO1/SenC/PrrC family)